LPALSDTGHLAEAYQMLLRRASPSWLYQVDQGATTVWERWDAILPDGSIHPGTMRPLDGDDGGQEGHMLSFNHYAYGAVIDWVYRHVAGLAPTLDAPGYRRVMVAPRPVRGIDWARAAIETAYGRVAIDWRLESDGPLRIELGLPFGVTGALDLPVSVNSRITVDGQASGPQATVGPGDHAIVVDDPCVVDSLAGR
jgi:alpha-L-rhamnosidase